ncbi:hypothetical protein DY000_02015211 [Brassica cretica]|uniref:Lon N-terminal domain-containing protein n=1 Tax=Brassica cretica TaxID=69181 RepID=A0ABQ7CZK3_BRACR|nr:hypothetical protein DY000_02015211 [Brassica cretica]
MASPPTCLRRQKKDRNPPPIDESLGTDGVSSDLSRLPPQKNDQNPSQSTTLSVITASCPLVLVFSDVRLLYQSSRRLLLRRAMSSVWRSASADFGAAICGANRHQAQEVLEELDVHKRLRLTLELMKKEREISKIQETIAKAIEEKISGEQCRYLLNEQLKAIKKELGVETDDKSALSGEY